MEISGKHVFHGNEKEIGFPRRLVDGWMVRATPDMQINVQSVIEHSSSTIFAAAGVSTC